jgi:ADP-ribosylglycohydrolase
MRMAAIGWTIDARNRALHEAAKSAQVTPNPRQGAQGSGAPSSSTGRAGKGKDRTVAFLVDRYGYACSIPLSHLPRLAGFDATFQGTVPAAVVSFLEPTDLEHAARKAVSPPPPLWRARHNASGSML